MNLSNELSLTTLKSKRLLWAMAVSNALASQSSFVSINRNKRPTIGLHIYKLICLAIGPKILFNRDFIINFTELLCFYK